MTGAARWPCLDEAQAHDADARLLLTLGHGAGPATPIGSVALPHLDALRDLAPELRGALDGKSLRLDWPANERDARFDGLNQALRGAGLILGWRDEVFPVWPLDAPPMTCVHRGRTEPLSRIERAAARFWGTLTLGAHCNGYVADAQGRPTHLWIARRSPHKATDPGRLDNLVGGGVPEGQTPFETLLREGWEEAGLTPSQMRSAQPAQVLSLLRDVREGLQREHLFGHDLQLDADTRPVNQDGEVAEFLCLDLREAMECAATGQMTVDAALVTLDFGLRLGLLGAEQAALAARLQRLCLRG